MFNVNADGYQLTMGFTYSFSTLPFCIHHMSSVESALGILSSCSFLGVAIYSIQNRFCIDT
jgi:hypothetical protein